VAPAFSWKSIPVRIKVAMTVLVAFFFSITVRTVIPEEEVRPIQAVLLLCNEALYGLALGLIIALVFAAVRFGGRIIEQQMGLSMAEILDPLTGDRSQPLGMFMEMMFILLLLSANGHHLLLLVISRSYEAFPAGSIPTVPVLTGGVLQAGSTLMIAGLRLAAPILAAFLLLMVTLAVLARVAQEMNILFISLPLRVGLGLMMAGLLFLPFLRGFVSEFADWMGKLLPI
jgi:flagellar biosynthetic protein FliR